MTGINSVMLGVCPTCDAIPVVYQRFRFLDRDKSQDLFKIVVGCKSLCDVVEYSCGCVLMRTGRVRFNQDASENGFTPYDMDAQWTSHYPCSQAERIVRELRAKQS